MGLALVQEDMDVRIDGVMDGVNIEGAYIQQIRMENKQRAEITIEDGIVKAALVHGNDDVQCTF
jgi:hypothetical protein